MEERFKKLDQNGDGRLTREEWPRPKAFDRLDSESRRRVDARRAEQARTEQQRVSETGWARTSRGGAATTIGLVAELPSRRLPVVAGLAYQERVQRLPSQFTASSSRAR